MALTVVVKSTEGPDLTTTGALKAVLMGATATSTVQDALLSADIRRATRWAETEVGQPLLAQTYRETVAAYGTRRLKLSRYPVRAILAIYDATDTGSANVMLTTQYALDAEAGMIESDNGWSWTVPFARRIGYPTMGGDAFPLEPWPMAGQEYRPWLVDYVAGYTYDGLSPSSPNWSTAPFGGGTDTGRTLPEDIEMAALLKAQAFYEGGDEAQSERLGDLAVNYRSLGTDKDGRLITRSRDLLAPYRRLA